MPASPQPWPLSWIARSHRLFVFRRRTRVLADALAPLLPQQGRVLDIGCGDGTIGALLTERRPGLTFEGIEYAPRPACRIPCRAFDGEHLPYPNGAFDACLFVDVLHHTQDVTALLREAARVARSAVVLKDHLSENSLDHTVLRLMDWVGNRPHGVILPYNYQSRHQWEHHFAECGLQPAQFISDVPLYSFPFSLIFGRGLHFAAKLTRL